MTTCDEFPNTLKWDQGKTIRTQWRSTYYPVHVKISSQYQTRLWQAVRVSVTILWFKWNWTKVCSSWPLFACENITVFLYTVIKFRGEKLTFTYSLFLITACIFLFLSEGQVGGSPDQRPCRRRPHAQAHCCHPMTWQIWIETAPGWMSYWQHEI